MVERGEAHVALRMPPTLTRAAQRNPDLRVIRLPGTSLYYFWLNLDLSPFTDPRVRKAVGLAVDREAIMQRIALGAASPARSMMEQTIHFSCPVGTLAYEPETARRLLREAGALGAPVRMLASEGQWELDRQVAEAVAGYLGEAGLRPELRAVADVAAFRELSAKRDVHMGLVAWPGRPPIPTTT
jgi:peptide/nickel transport system substrate-binding protein